MLLAALGTALLTDMIPDSLFADEPEPAEVAMADRAAERRKTEVRRDGMAAVRVLNRGTIDEDPARHAAVVAEMERVANNPIDVVTDDDDLTTTGTYADWYPAKVKTFRTVCVRLCDGALTPVSFATTQDRLALDALRCRKSCNNPSKLYIQRNPATDSEGLVDLDGNPYKQLTTAFKFRTSYDDSCTCRPHAWQITAQVRHKLHGIQDRQRHGHKVVKGRMSTIKLAVARASRVADAGSASKFGHEIVTGSAGRVTGASPTVSAAIIAKADQSVLDVSPQAQAAAKVARSESGRKRSGKRKLRPADVASAKAARAKAKNNAALVVLFGEAPEAKSELSAAAGSVGRPQKPLQSARFATRRYDGKDWRISIYEPM